MRRAWILLLLLAGAGVAQRYLYTGFQECVGGGCTFSNQYTDAKSDDAASWTQTAGTLGIAANAPIVVEDRGKWVMILAQAHDGVAYGYLINVYTSPVNATGTYTWTLQTTIDWHTNISGLAWCFAPGPAIDDDGTLRIFAPCNTTGTDTGFTIYESHPSTPGDYTAWAAPTAKTVTGMSNVIDFRPFKWGSTWYAWYKNETTKFIEIATASTLSASTWTPTQTSNWSGFGFQVEGPGQIYIGENLRAYFEDYIAFQMYYSDCPVVTAATHANLVASYDFTEGSGTTLHDRTGSDDCTLVGTPTWTAHGSSFSLTLNGSTQKADCGNPSNLNFSGSDFTILMAFKNVNSTFYQVLVNKGDGASASGSQYEILTTTSGDAKLTGDVFIGSTNYSARAPSTLVNGGWHIAALSRTGTVHVLYMDGVVQALTNQSGTINNTANHVVLGATGGTGSLFFNGELAWAEFYNAGFTDAEQKAAYARISNSLSGRSLGLRTYGSTPDTCSWTLRTKWTVGTCSPLSSTCLYRHGSIQRNPGWLAAGSQ